MTRFAASIRRAAASVVFTAVTFLVGTLGAQSQSGSPIIRSVEIQYVGPQTISRERILSQIRTRVGQPYSNTTAEQDIRSLYNSGGVQNVRIFGQPDGDGVKVMVVVQTRSIVHEIEINGAQRISAAKIRHQIKVKTNTPVNEAELEKGRQSIVDMYQAKGFPGVNVQFRVDTDEKRAVSRVIYTIDEGEKGAISAIRFNGNTKFSDRVLRKQMKTKGKTLYSFLDKSGRLDEAQLQQDLDSVREWYQNHGYVDVAIKETRKDRVNGRLYIVVVLVEGPRYRVGKIRITGQKIASEGKIRALLKLKEGNIYSPKAVRDDAKTLADAYGTGGYVDLNLAPQAAPAGPGRIDLTYNIEEGTRSFVQRINIVGNVRTKDKVIRREVLIAPGDVYNTVRVETTKKRLDNLGYFSRVETFPDDTGVAGRKDLTVQVEEKRTGSLNFGAGFSTVDNLVGFVEVTQGNFDLMDWPNFTGAGQKFRSRIQYGTQRKDFIISLTEPYFLDRRLSLGGEAFYHEASFLSSVYDQRNYGFSIDVRKPINSYLAASFGYRLESVEVFNISQNVTPQLRNELGGRTKSLISSSLSFDTRDNPFLTRRGSRVVLSPYLAGGFLGGNTQIYGGDLSASQYFHLPWDTILLLNGEIAVVNTWGNGDRVPIYDRLFLGGSNDLRGFEFRDVSPRDANGEPLGGRSLARLTVEYTVPIIEKARGAIFYDTGFVNVDAYDFSTKHIVSDIGIGVRLDLPIGPIRIDYGIPIQKDGIKGNGKFNFNVGYQF